MSHRDNKCPGGSLEERLAWRREHEHVEKIREAGTLYLRALANRRDALRLVDLDFERATRKHAQRAGGRAGEYEP